MAEVVDLHGAKNKKPGTPPEIATALRDCVERMIECGIVGGIIAGERLDGDIFREAIPPSGAFLEGMICILYREMNSTDEDD